MTPQEEQAAASCGGDAPPAAEAADADDMFGPPRAAPAIRPRLSMISARLRANEERKRVIEICSQKLESIEDPAADLRRSVCINNTYCRLSEDARREKESRRAERRAREPEHEPELPSALSPPGAPGPPGPPGALGPPRPPADDAPCGKRARRQLEDECLALLDAIPELADAALGCGRMSRLPSSPHVPPHHLLAVLDS